MAFHRYLDGDGEIPIEHWFGRVSEEFGGALPSVIWREMQRLPIGFLEQVIEYRAYERAHAANQADPKGSESTPMRRLALENEAALALEGMMHEHTNG